MTDAREQLLELIMRDPEGYTVDPNAALDALLSDEGRPLLIELLVDTDNETRAMVEYLKERGVLVPYGQRCAWDDETEQDVAIPLCELRLPGESTDDLDDARYYAETGRLPGGES